jgi:hypothetical protein
MWKQYFIFSAVEKPQPPSPLVQENTPGDIFSIEQNAKKLEVPSRMQRQFCVSLAGFIVVAFSPNSTIRFFLVCERNNLPLFVTIHDRHNIRNQQEALHAVGLIVGDLNPLCGIPAKHMVKFWGR